MRILSRQATPATNPRRDTTAALDRPALRAVALFLTIAVLFGWDWGYSYRSGLVDTLELPIWSVLLLVAASLPSQFRGRAVAIVLAAIGISNFAWWATERAQMSCGGCNFGYD